MSLSALRSAARVATAALVGWLLLATPASGVEGRHRIWRVSSCSPPSPVMDDHRVRICDVKVDLESADSPCGDRRSKRRALLERQATQRPLRETVKKVTTQSPGAEVKTGQYLDTDPDPESELPEWETIPVAGGIGMGGVRPAHCSFIADKVVRFPDPELMRAVAALRNSEGRTIGTATLIAPDLLLTALHVVCGTIEKVGGSAAVAVFDTFLSDSATQRPFEDESDYRIESDGIGESDVRLPVLVGASQRHDYALLRLLPARRDSRARHGHLPGHRGIRPVPVSVMIPAPAVGSRVHVLGYTENVFFPRGLVLSTDGYVEPLVRRIRPDTTTLHYNLQTARGFSGAPVFDSDFRWIGQHTSALSVPVHAATGSAVWRDFDLPNGGHMLHDILAHIASTHTREWLIDNFDKGPTLAALLAGKKDDATAIFDSCQAMPDKN